MIVELDGREFLGMWFEPWRAAHPSWLQMNSAGAACWDHRSFSRAAGRRTYRAWCMHFGLEPALPAWWADVDLQQAGMLPSRLDQAEEGAVVVGAVACASLPQFAQMWLSDGAALASIASAGSWRDAVRLAKSRRLRVDGLSLDTALTRAGLVARGLVYLRDALDARWPGLWGRLRFRFDRVCVLDAERAAGMAASVSSEAHCRHVLRAWRLGSGAVL